MLTKIKNIQSKLVTAFNQGYIFEFFVYLLIFGITFSNALVDSALGFIILLFIIKKIFKDKLCFPKTGIGILILLLGSIILISFLRSAYPKDSFKGVLRILKYSLLYFGMVDFLTGDTKRIKRIFWVFIGISIFTFYNGIFQGIFGFDLLKGNKLINQDCLNRISSSFVHPNDFAAFIITLLPLTLTFLYKKFRNSSKAILLLVLLLGIFCLLKTSSRGAWLGFIFCIFIYFYFVNRKISLFIPVVLIALIVAYPHGLERLIAIFNLKSSTVWERTKLWEGTWNMIKAHPLVGFGINTYSRYFPLFKPTDYPDLRYAHNSYLQMWSEIGLIGLSTFLLIIFATLKNAFIAISKSFKNNFSLNGFVLLGLTSGYIAFLIQSAMDTNLYSLVLITLFWLITACITAISMIINKGGE